MHSSFDGKRKRVREREESQEQNFGASCALLCLSIASSSVNYNECLEWLEGRALSVDAYKASDGPIVPEIFSAARTLVNQFGVIVFWG